MNLTNYQKPMWLAVAGLAVVAMLAGPMPASAQNQKLTVVHFANAGVGVFRLPLYVAIQNGYFKDQGLDLQIVDTRSGSDASKMLAGAAVEFTAGQVLDAVNLNLQGINVRGVFMMTSRLTNSILVRSDLANEIHTLADLNGRPIGVTGVGSGTWQFAAFIAKKQGIDPEKLNFVGTGPGAGVFAAVESKRVAITSHAEPETLQLVANGDSKMLIDAGDPATHEKYIGKDYVNNWIMTLQSFADAHPEDLQKFVNALQLGLNWANQHSPEEIASLLQKVQGFDTTDHAVLVEAVKRQGIPANGVITKSAFDNAIALPLTIGAIKDAMTIDQLVVNKFSEQAAATLAPKK